MFAVPFSLSSTGKVGLHAVALLTCLLAGISTLAIAEEASDAATAVTNTTENLTRNSSNKQLGRVARDIFTTAIVDREPVDDLSSISNDTQRIFYFSDLRGLAGQIITHRWEYNDQVMAEVTFKVGKGVRWRVYSSKNLLPEWTGQWTVVVSDENGNPLKTSVFEYSTAVAGEVVSTKP